MRLDISWRAIIALIVGTIVWRLDVIELMVRPVPPAVCAAPVAATAELKF